MFLFKKLEELPSQLRLTTYSRETEVSRTAERLSVVARESLNTTLTQNTTLTTLNSDAHKKKKSLHTHKKIKQK